MTEKDIYRFLRVEKYFGMVIVVNKVGLGKKINKLIRFYKKQSYRSPKKEFLPFLWSLRKVFEICLISLYQLSKKA